MVGPMSGGPGAVLDGLLADLADEAGVLMALLDEIPESSWSTPTPAPGWSVRDQVAHLAHFDWVTRLCVSRPEEFIALRDGIPDLQAYVDSIGPANASRDGQDHLRWWRDQHQRLVAAVRAAPAGTRVPWFGPSMSLASKVTARIMETWAHGQDVVDALGLERPATDRLRHVARIGVLAMPNSFATHGRDVPEAPIRVALTAPDGHSAWEWGDADAMDAVTGPAEDFCLVVTQRRHVDDTQLRVTGSAATAWIEVAQAFAGPAGAGRSPGQFAGAAR
jgi:uncharacterized protein (TIGR03084 family)